MGYNLSNILNFLIKATMNDDFNMQIFVSDITLVFRVMKILLSTYYSPVLNMIIASFLGSDA